ncbi:hypothetical protein A8924_5199 [Saccharopolyspora erythraea NRRL 2338]|nr:hypothetical protein A8924_5199 [Saccharopolyspora erythraea NRRL 2338]
MTRPAAALRLRCMNDPGVTDESLADAFRTRLRTLFEQTNPQTGRPYTAAQAADWIRANTNHSISHTQVWKLLTGRAVPRLTEVELLARFFDVSPSALLPGPQGEDLDRLALVGSLGVRELALRQLTADVAPESREQLAGAIKAVLEAFRARPDPAPDEGERRRDG